MIVSLLAGSLLLIMLGIMRSGSVIRKHLHHCRVYLEHRRLGTERVDAELVSEPLK
jgi:hypothetical protein